MKVEIEKLPRKTVKFKITLAKEKVAQTREHVIDEMVKEVEIPGFRKGLAPRSLTEPKLDEAAVRGQIINHLIPQAYDQAVKESLVKPIILPKIEVLSFEAGADLVFSATTAEAPEISLGNYKEKLSTLNSLPRRQAGQLSTSKTILGPDGQPLSKPDEEKDAEAEKINQIFEILLETSTIDVPELLVEDELNRMLGRLLEQVNRLGISLDQYLQSVGKTVESLKGEYRQMAEKNIKLEFLLLNVARQEEIKVEESEISATIEATPDQKSRQDLAKAENRVYLESILLKNKVVQKLLVYSE